MSNPTITINLEHGRKITAELYPDRAPSNVKYFLSYVETYYYESVPVHTCIKDKVVAMSVFQKYGLGYGSEEFYEIFTEDSEEYETVGVHEKYPHEVGTLALVEPQIPETCRQMLAVILTDEPIIRKGKPIVFRPIGKVLSGLEYAQEMSEIPTDEDDTPIDTVFLVESIDVN